MRPMTGPLLVGLALSACAGQPAATTIYRNPALPISSAALFDGARFQGDWQVVAAFGAEAGCGALQERWQADAGGFAVRGTRCGPTGKTGYATRARPVGPGRITREMRDGTEEIWVLWVDADYRIAALGTPSGGFGRILVRPGQARADLIIAAREIMDFNGYDVSRLIVLR